jgi:hypothetical protein
VRYLSHLSHVISHLLHASNAISAFDKCNIAFITLILLHALSRHTFHHLPPQGCGIHSVVTIPAPWPRNHDSQTVISYEFLCVRYLSHLSHVISHLLHASNAISAFDKCIIATQRTRGPPCHHDTTEESDSSESDSDDSDSSTDDDPPTAPGLRRTTNLSQHRQNPPPSQNHAPTTRSNVPSLPRNHQLHPRQW